jgi:Outer membrane lipoprotein carrier protein LolA-like
VREARCAAWPVARLTPACALALACALLPAAAPGTAATPPSPGSGSLDQLLQLLAARSHGHVTFTEVHQLAVLDRPLQSSGELLYDAPDRLEKRTLQPKPEELILDHGILTARRGSRSRVLALREYPQIVPFLESIRATLAGDRAGLERYFAVQYSGSLDHWVLELTPTGPEVARAVEHIRITGERGAVHSVEIRETDGDASVLTVGGEVAP